MEIIHFDGVSKKYRIRSRNSSLREAISSIPSRLSRKKQAPEDAGILWAVKDLSFEVRRGTILGIIGSNGAGKTTTLKLLSRVTQPSTGSITVNGRVSSLIELGAGFHPDLSGKDNIYLNGAILGLNRREIDRRFDQIVAFAEMERFLEMPVKRYSSGMYARLGFAVAAHTDPDLLLVDEVLAVGDINFQQKCYEFIHHFVTSGKTAVFVSHNMYVIDQLCSHLIWLDQGQKQAEGKPESVLSQYLDFMEMKRLSMDESLPELKGDLQIEGVRFLNQDGNECSSFRSGEDLLIEVRYNAAAMIEKPHFVLSVVDSQDNRSLIMASMLADGQAPDLLEGRGKFTCRLYAPPLMPRVYYLFGEVYGADRIHLLSRWQKLGAFRVELNPVEQAAGSGSLRHTRADAPVRVPYAWDFRSGATSARE